MSAALQPLSYATTPFARGAAVVPLILQPPVGATSTVGAYDFVAPTQSLGLLAGQLAVSYVAVLLADQGDRPAQLEVEYVLAGATQTCTVPVPGKTIAGTQFAIPTPPGTAPLLLAISEHPAPANGVPAGPSKWRVWALLGDYGRLLWTVAAEANGLVAEAADVKAQHHLASARDCSLDTIGQALRVPRLMPAPYRDDPSHATLALYHLDDVIAPVIDAMRAHPGVAHGAQRGVTGVFGSGASTATGGITVPDDDGLTIGATADFTVEAFVLDGRDNDTADAVYVAKRARDDGDLGPGWALESVNGNYRFIIADGYGNVVTLGAVKTTTTAWVHLMASLARATNTVQLAVNGVVVATMPLGALGQVQTCADLSFGATYMGISRFNGTLDEIRLSSVARMAALPAEPHVVDGDTIALYHLDETDDVVDDATGLHPGMAQNVDRSIVGRFGGATRFANDTMPPVHSAAEMAFLTALRSGAWEQTAGGAIVTDGPYARYRYKQGAMSVTAMNGNTEPVYVNDTPDVDASVRGFMTSADAGFIPHDVDGAIAKFTAAGRTPQEAIDYVGEWYGYAASWFATTYALYHVTATYEPCADRTLANARITVPAASDLAFGATDALTVEAFVRPEATTEIYERAVAVSDAQTSGGGWLLGVLDSGSMRNAAHVRFSDGTTTIQLFGNTDLADGRWHHLAGVVDRDTAIALLFVDGIEIGRRALGALGALTTGGGFTIGNDAINASPYSGDIDEVRLSKAPEWTFSPVLGESDERYRCRLAIFQPYRMPNLATLRRLVGALTLPPATDTDVRATAVLLDPNGSAPDDAQFDLVEGGGDRPCASLPLRVVPDRLAPGMSIASDGTSPAAALAYTRIPPQSAIFRAPDVPGIVFATETARYVALRGFETLEAIAARAQAIGVAPVTVSGAYAAGNGDAFSAGCALLLGMGSPVSGFDSAALGALVHALGVEWVAIDAGQTVVTAMVLPQNDVRIAGPDDLDVGADAGYGIDLPVLPAGTAYDWGLLPCGPGAVTIEDHGASIILHGVSYGTVTLAVTCTLPNGDALRAARDLTVAPVNLDTCLTIASDGRTDVDAVTAAGEPETDIDATDMIRDTSPALDFASEAARYGQLVLQQALAATAALANIEPGAPRITVTEAYSATSSDPLQVVGRAAVIVPSSSTLTVGRLAALAHLAGCAYVERRRYPPSVYIAVAPGARYGLQPVPIVDVWPNANVDAYGRVQLGEAGACGTPESPFDPSILVTYTSQPITQGTPAPKMHPRAASLLSALVATLTDRGLAPAALTLVAAYDPTVQGVESVGRGLVLRHTTLNAGSLAAIALQVGFEYAENRPYAIGGPAAYAALLPAAVPSAVPSDGIVLGGFKALTVVPATSGRTYDWCINVRQPASAYRSSQPDGAVLVHGAAYGALAVSAAEAQDATEPYQCRVVPRGRGTPRITFDQYEDVLNALETYHPIGVEVATTTLRPAVDDFLRIPRWDRVPTAQTYVRYRAAR